MCFSQSHYSIDERERTRTRPQEEISRGKNPSHESNCRQNIQSNALQRPGTECQGCPKYVGYAQGEFRMLTLWHGDCQKKCDVRSTDRYDAIRTYNLCKIYLGQKNHCEVVCQDYEVMVLGCIISYVRNVASQLIK